MSTPGLEKEWLDRLEGPLVRFENGQRIFTEGEVGKVMYLIRAGEVGIETDGMPLATLWPGDVFGEMSIIDGSTRSASAMARSEVEAIAIDRDGFVSIVREKPEFALHLLALLSTRVRELNALI